MVEEDSKAAHNIQDPDEVEEVEPKKVLTADEAKALGTEEFKKKNYEGAVDYFTLSLGKYS
jgi:hypothetical protein